MIHDCMCLHVIISDSFMQMTYSRRCLELYSVFKLVLDIDTKLKCNTSLCICSGSITVHFVVLWTTLLGTAFQQIIARHQTWRHHNLPAPVEEQEFTGPLFINALCACKTMNLTCQHDHNSALMQATRQSCYTHASTNLF